MTTQELARKEALGIRGRFGTDIWDQYINLPGGKQHDFLIRQGVPQSRIISTHFQLNKILIAEGLK